MEITRQHFCLFCSSQSILLNQASLASLLELHTALIHLVQQTQPPAQQQIITKQQRSTDKERLAWLAAFRPHGAGLLSLIRPRYSLR